MRRRWVEAAPGEVATGAEEGTARRRGLPILAEPAPWPDTSCTPARELRLLDRPGRSRSRRPGGRGGGPGRRSGAGDAALRPVRDARTTAKTSPSCWMRPSRLPGHARPLVGASAHGCPGRGRESRAAPPWPSWRSSGLEAHPFLAPDRRQGAEGLAGEEIAARRELGRSAARGPGGAAAGPAHPAAGPLLEGVREAAGPGAASWGAGAADPGLATASLQWCGRKLETGALAGHGAARTERGAARRRDPGLPARHTDWLTVTRAEGHWISELDGRPALDVYREVARGPLADDLRARGGLPAGGASLRSRRPRALCAPAATWCATWPASPPENGLRPSRMRPKPGDRIALALREPETAREDLKAMLPSWADSAGLGLYFDCCARGESFFGISGPRGRLPGAGLRQDRPHRGHVRLLRDRTDRRIGRAAHLHGRAGTDRRVMLADPANPSSTTFRYSEPDASRRFPPGRRQSACGAPVRRRGGIVERLLTQSTVEKAVESPLPPARRARGAGRDGRSGAPSACPSRAPTACWPRSARRGLVERDERGRYRTGMGLVALGLGALEREPVVVAARPVLEEEAERLGETVFLVAARAGRSGCWTRPRAPDFCARRRGSGSEVPVHATAVGKLFLAFAEETIPLLPGRSRALHTETRTDRRDLAAEVEQAPEPRVRGEPRGVDPGAVRVVAAPVIANARMAAAVAVAAPTARLEALGPERVARTDRRRRGPRAARLEGSLWQERQMPERTAHEGLDRRARRRTPTRRGSP